MTTIRFDHVSHAYGATKIVEDFSLIINSGEFISIVGSSGSGKTTIMKMINGLVIPNSGDVLVEGESVQSQDAVKLRRKIGYSIQGNVLFPHLTVGENISYVLDLMEYSAEQKATRIQELLETFQLSADIVDRFPHEISGGQAQRVGIARAYASKPGCLLMDEPFGAVDAITRYQLQKDLKKWQQQLGLTIVFITHDIREALSMSSKVLVLHDGKVQQFDTPENILNHPAPGFVEELIAMST
ncbi:ABC transporter ATP-binding protein [Corynebacterium sp. HS2168-gen11]|uniref:ATP-binding cassette domain-containing protein n=1 Tax=Corynebacterium sp. HS2168-gen11 TaxID=2974027 RepID=UPI00216B20B7|nr:ABC transporter ATP-binding protein [Corynebacterium sp. HS2168-gen11]MCS4535817.1 ABC transporter ATP-binding protein [Corynebacterium sp. HS2168-gen11]